MPRERKQETVWRRKRAKILKQPPLPIPIASISNGIPTRQSWYCYTGYLQGSTVVVKHSGDVDFLYRMGFFGKGTLSRSEPNYFTRHPKVNICFPSYLLPDLGPERESSSSSTIQVAVMTKRHYLKHLQYKALWEDDETGYNELLEQETMQRYKQGQGEDELEDGDDDDEEAEESDESDDGGPKLQGMGLEDLITDNSSYLFFVMAQVAQLSKENIATFVKVSESLQDLESKYQKKRLEQMKRINILESIKNMKATVPNSPISQSALMSEDVIDLSDEEDDVVVLSSDEESKHLEHCKDDVILQKGPIAHSSWDDPGNDGDALFWGMGDVVHKRGKGKGSEMEKETISSSSSNVPSLVIQNEINSSCLKSDDGDSGSKIVDKQFEHDSKTEGVTNVAKESSVSRRPSQEESENEQKLKDSLVSNNGSKIASKQPDHDSKFEKIVNIAEETSVIHPPQNEDENEERLNDLYVSNNRNDNSGDVNDDQTKEIHEERISEDDAVLKCTGIKLVSKESNSILSNFTAFTKSPTLSKISILNVKSFPNDDDIHQQNKPSLPSTENNDSEDNDVICVEDGSAEPSKLHNYLSQALNQKDTAQRPVISKMVRFMTNITKEPMFVKAKVGFYAWKGSLHFNFSGDEVHLPSAFEVLKDESSLDPHHPLANVNSENEVYERIFPPANSFLSSPESKGVVIKQRLDGIPFLEIAKRNVITSLVNKKLQESHSLKENVPFTHNKVFHSWQQPDQPLQSPLSSFSNSSLPQRSGSIQSEKKEASSLNLSHLNWYIHVFRREGPNGTGKKCGQQKEKEGKLSSIHKIHDQLKESLKEKRMVTSDDPQVLKFNCLLSEYLSENGISLIRELILLKMLVCGSEIICEIPKVDMLEAKSSITPEENVYLLERLDFIQTCLLSKQAPSLSQATSTGKNGTESVIMIDLSDEESVDANKLHVKQSSYSSTEDSSPKSESASIGQDPSANCRNTEETDFWTVSFKDKAYSGEDQPLDAGISSKEIVPSRRKRLRQDSEDSASGIDSKILKQYTGNSSGSRGDDKLSSINSNNKNSIRVSNQEGIGSVLGSESSKNEISDKKSESQKDASTGMAQGSQLEVSCLDQPFCPQVVQHELSNLGKMNEDDSRKSENYLENTNLFAQKSMEKSKRNVQKSLPEDQIYIESSDEEEKRVNIGKSRQSGKLNTVKHPYSMKDNLAGDLFVVPNTSDEEDDDMENLSEYFVWQPCVKQDPYPSKEQLHLLLEEAFFLSYGLGCLKVLDPEKKPVSLIEMWQQFSQLKDTFVPHYVAYHYFRSKGWVPKSGLKFGCDFVLYREGPPFYHGSYSVVVVAVQEGSLTPMVGDEVDLDFPQRMNNWIAVSGLNRMTEHVAKELMYCYVVFPKDFTEDESKSPKCISRLKIKEVIVSRWVSSKERECKDKEEIP